MVGAWNHFGGKTVQISPLASPFEQTCGSSLSCLFQLLSGQSSWYCMRSADMARSCLSLLGLLALVASTSAAPARRQAEVDYVLVGGGPAGFVLAEYLTRNPDVKVVLLEAGQDSSTDPLVTSTSSIAFPARPLALANNAIS